MSPNQRTKSKRDPPSNNKGNNGGSSSSGDNNTGNARKLMKDADSVKDFLERLAELMEIKKTGATDKQKLMCDGMLYCFESYYSLAEATVELQSYGVAPSETTNLYTGLLTQLKSNVQREFQDLCVNATKERKAMMELMMAHEDREKTRELLEFAADREDQTKEEAIKNQESKNVLPDIGDMGADLHESTSSDMTEQMNQLLLSHSKLDEKLQRFMQQTRDKYSNLEKELKTVQEFLHKDLEKRLDTVVQDRLSVIGSGIANKVAGDIRVVVASAAKQEEVNRSINQLQQNLYAKLEESQESQESLKCQMNKNHELVRMELELCKTAIQERNSAQLSQIDSLLTAVQLLSSQLADNKNDNVPEKSYHKDKGENSKNNSKKSKKKRR